MRYFEHHIDCKRIDRVEKVEMTRVVALIEGAYEGCSESLPHMAAFYFDYTGRFVMKEDPYNYDDVHIEKAKDALRQRGISV